MKLNQIEMSECYGNDERVVLNYRTAYGIYYSKAINGYAMRKLMTTRSGLPYTKRGRYHSVSPDFFEKIK